MEKEDKQGRIVLLEEEIANFMTNVQKFIDESKESYSYEEKESLLQENRKINSKINELIREKEFKEKRIKDVKKQKKAFPLVPIEEIEPNFQELIKEVEGINAFCNSERTKRFLALYKKLDKKLDKVTEEVSKKIRHKAVQQKNKMDYERAKITEERLESFFKEPRESEGVQKIIKKPYLADRGVKYEYLKGSVISKGFFDLYREFGDFIRIPGFLETPLEWTRELDLHNCLFPPTVTDTYWPTFSCEPYEECSVRWKQVCREVELELEEIKNSPQKQYDRPGVVSFELKNSNLNVKVNVTQRELAKAGILPKELGWKRARNISADIADEDRRQELTTSEVGGVKVIIDKLLDRFKGKGEK